MEAFVRHFVNEPDRDTNGAERDRHDRRRVLAALAGTGLTAVAGCSAGSDPTPSTTDTPASTTDAEAPASTTTQSDTETTTTETGPSVRIETVAVESDPPRQFQSVPVSVTVTNAGGESFDGRVTATTGDADDEVGSVTIPPGESVTHTAEFEWRAVGDADLTVTVQRNDEQVTTATRTVTVRQYPADPVEVDGTTLTCGDGSAYYAGSTLSYVNNSPSNVEPENLNVSFTTLSNAGGTVCRLWAHAPFWADFQTVSEPYTYEEAWFDYLDEIVAAAKRHDVRLVLSMFNGNPAYGELTEDDLGTNVPQFVRWADDAETRNDFFDSDECMEMYKDWVQTLLTHENSITGLEYRNDPTIMMWELGNEIQKSPPKVGESIRPWIEEAGSFVKEIDDRTLLTTGSYGHQGRNAFVEEASADPIDVASVHYYPSPENYDVPDDRVTEILAETIRTTHEEIGKPLYVGEYNWGVSSDATTPLTERNDALGRLHDVMLDRDVAVSNLWTMVSWSRNDVGSPGNHQVYAASDEGTITELRRHAERMTEKSTSSSL